MIPINKTNVGLGHPIILMFLLVYFNKKKKCYCLLFLFLKANNEVETISIFIVKNEQKSNNKHPQSEGRMMTLPQPTSINQLKISLYKLLVSMENQSSSL